MCLSNLKIDIIRQVYITVLNYDRTRIFILNYDRNRLCFRRPLKYIYIEDIHNAVRILISNNIFSLIGSFWEYLLFACLNLSINHAGDPTISFLVLKIILLLDLISPFVFFLIVFYLDFELWRGIWVKTSIFFIKIHFIFILTSKFIYYKTGSS